MHSLSFQQNTGFPSSEMINRYQSGLADKHAQIRAAVRAWAASLDNQDVVAGLIVEEWERQGGVGLNFSNDLSRKRQKLFRWLDSDTGYSRKNIRQLTPAILAVLPLEHRGSLVGGDCKLTRLANAEKEVGEAKRAVLLDAPRHQKLKEMSEGIVSMLRLEPDLTGPLMAMVTTLLGAM